MTVGLLIDPPHRVSIYLAKMAWMKLKAQLMMALLSGATARGYRAPAPAPAPAVVAQGAGQSVPVPALPVPVDASLTAAENLQGRALFLRGLYLSNDLVYNVAGGMDGSAQSGDWTLAAVNVQRAVRIGADTIELDGVRAGIRYNPDAHEFQRRPRNDVRVKMLVRLAPNSETDARQLRKAFAAMFAVGIDPALQRAMPAYWRHYFDPGLPWPADALTGVMIYTMTGSPDQPKDVTPPVATTRVEPEFGEAAARDRVRGVLQMRLVVDADGVPRRIAVAQPVGYGLEAKAAEALAKWRFTPAMRAGKPVAATILVNLDFETAPQGRPPRP
jgi:TonB family protein